MADDEIRPTKESYEAGLFKSRMWLVSKGVPFQAAMGMDDMLLALCVIGLHEAGGGRYDWEAHKFLVPTS